MLYSPAGYIAADAYVCVGAHPSCCCLAAGRMPDVELAASIAGHLDRTLQLQQTPHADAVHELGRNCHMPNALQTPIHAVIHHEWLAKQQQQQGEASSSASASALHSSSVAQKQDVFVAALREVMLAGGCCASRASYAGACLGALLGPEAVPASWLQRCDAGENVLQWAAAVCGAREGA
jgi:ADP-ribosylglycohydrolase